jgi:hypothetical protein
MQDESLPQPLSISETRSFRQRPPPPPSPRSRCDRVHAPQPPTADPRAPGTKGHLFRLATRGRAGRGKNPPRGLESHAQRGERRAIAKGKERGDEFARRGAERWQLRYHKGASADVRTYHLREPHTTARTRLTDTRSGGTDRETDMR